MKKIVLTLAAMAAVVSASAFGLKENQPVRPKPGSVFVTGELVSPVADAAAMKSASRAETAQDTEEVLYMPAYEPSSIVGFDGQKAGMQIAMAIQIAPESVTEMAGSELTSIVFYTGAENYSNPQVNKLSKATVFITNNLQGTFLYTQEVSCPGQPGARVEVPLDTPFVLEAGQKVYVGVYYTLNSPNNYPIVTDYILHDNDYGGWVAYRNTPSQPWTWQNAYDQLGFLCIGAMVRGKNFAHDSASITLMDAVPVNYQNEAFLAAFRYVNNGINDIDNLTVEYGIEGEPLKTTLVRASGNIGFLKTGIVSLPDVTAANAAKSANVYARITEVNGVPNTASAESAAAVYPVRIIPTGKGFTQNVVIEEFTSTSCIYCPIGYTGMEYVHENYPDGELIPVCIHVNSPGRDVMMATSYQGVFNRYCKTGVPSAIMNRQYDVYPMTSEIIDMFEQVSSLPAIASVSATATFDPETRELTVDSHTSFSFDYTDGDKTFALSYGVTEDQVGPYNQQNGYSGQSGNYAGWESQPSPVSLVYNDVARQLSTLSGIAGSVPAEINAGEEYDFSQKLTLLQSIGDVNHINVVVYLVNKTTGVIENAVTLKSGDIAGLETDGIEAVAADGMATDAPVEYFNLQGMKVAHPSGGIFIRRQGAVSEKVAL